MLGIMAEYRTQHRQAGRCETGATYFLLYSSPEPTNQIGRGIAGRSVSPLSGKTLGGELESDNIDLFEHRALFRSKSCVQRFTGRVGKEASASLIVNVKSRQERFQFLRAHAAASDTLFARCLIRPRRSASRAKSSWPRSRSIGGYRPSRSRITISGREAISPTYSKSL